MVNTTRKIAEGATGIWHDIKDIWSKASLLAFIVTLPTFAFATWFNHFIQPAKDLYEIIALTWPAVCSATIFFMMVMRRWFSDKEGAGIFWALVGLIVAPYVIAALLGATELVDRRVATPGIGWLQFLHPAHALKLAVDIVLYYFSAYGIWKSISAVACGAFLAWAYEKKILPRARSLRDDLDSADTDQA